MIQFWKKQAQKEENPTIFSLDNGPDNSTDHCSKSDNKRTNVHKQPNLISIDETELNDLIKEANNNSEESVSLSKTTLFELLHDKSALGYFVQYMKLRNAVTYILCWIDINNFNCAVREVLGTPNENASVSSSLPCFKIDVECLSLNTDCDSNTADSISVSDSIEKAELDATNEEIKLECYENYICTKKLADETKITQKFVDYALKIFKKYIALEASFNIMCSEDIRKEIIENICDEDMIVSGNCFLKVQNFLINIMEKDYLEDFLASDYYCKHKIDVLTSGHILLKDILYNETALFYFMEFLEQENSRDLLEFWLAATNFEQQMHTQHDLFDSIEAQNDAVVLYDKYFSLQALCPLGFDDKIRISVEQNICGDNEGIFACFRLPLKIVEYVLEKNYLKQFLSSQLFYKYLSELINTVQTNGLINNFERNKYSPSDCSSEKSFWTNNTFLAMENPNKNKTKNTSTDMRIDIRQLYDPDSLWKRKKNNRLSFGRITELGRFETDFEPEPDKNKSLFKNVVKKFVKLEENKRKEEMAWQVAEMIVKDITSITLSDHKSFES